MNLVLSKRFSQALKQSHYPNRVSLRSTGQCFEIEKKMNGTQPATCFEQFVPIFAKLKERNTTDLIYGLLGNSTFFFVGTEEEALNLLAQRILTEPALP